MTGLGFDDSEYMAQIEEVEDDFLVIDDEVPAPKKKPLEPLPPAKAARSNTTVEGKAFGITN